MWSWHSSDPEDEASVLQHQFKGATSLNLLGGLNNPPPIPPDSDSFTITMESVRQVVNVEIYHQSLDLALVCFLFACSHNCMLGHRTMIGFPSRTELIFLYY